MLNSKLKMMSRLIMLKIKVINTHVMSRSQLPKGSYGNVIIPNSW